jgi:methylated-DNA-[protein]-cysteine S-methyltransferase
MHRSIASAVTERFSSAIATPFGAMEIAVDARGVLVEVLLPNRCTGVPEVQRALPSEARRGLQQARMQLREYFEGRRRAFELACSPDGSPFEQRVWSRLCTIPYGATVSYGAIAQELGLVNGARAVGHANGANPIPIVIPCHRVIGSDGTLTGFGGGLSLKRALLELEGALAQPYPTLF